MKGFSKFNKINSREKHVKVNLHLHAANLEKKTL